MIGQSYIQSVFVSFVNGILWDVSAIRDLFILNQCYSVSSVDRFYLENNVRKFLNSLYISVTNSTHNAQMLAHHSLSEILPESIEGSNMVKKSMIYVITWLTKLEQSPLPHIDYISERTARMTKSVSQYILNIRSLEKRTQSITGYIFSISPRYYDKYYDDNLVSVSLVIPKLAATMSLRYNLENENIHTGYFDLIGVQPIPFVNRIHPKRLSVAENFTSDFSLKNLDFIKVSFHDVFKLSCSFELENYCEIYSSQTKRRHLGIPFVLAGIFESYSRKIFVLECPGKPEITISIFSSQPLIYYLEKNLDSLTGRPVRVLCVCWYLHGNDSSLLPEAFLIEDSLNIEEALLDDLSGFLRLRGNMSKMDINSFYSRIGDSAALSYYRNESGNFEWNGYVGEITDLPSKIFLDSKNSFTKSILEDNPVISKTNPFTILETERIDRKRIIQILSDNSHHLRALMKLLAIRDRLGRIPADLTQLCRETGFDRKTLEPEIGLFMNLGLVSGGDDLGTTEFTLEIAYLCISDRLSAVLQREKNNTIDIIEFSKRTRIPILMLIKALKNEEKRGAYCRVIMNGFSSRILWLNTGSKGQDMVRIHESSISNYFRDILNGFLQVPYPINIHKLFEIVNGNGSNYSFSALKLIIEDLVMNKRIVKSGEYLVYPIESRIYDTIIENPERIFTLESIIKHASISKSNLAEVVSILDEFTNSGKISKIGRSKWTSCIHLDSKIHQEITGELRRFVLSQVGEKPIKDHDLYPDLLRKCKSLDILRKDQHDPYNLCEETIECLLSDKKIIKIHDTFYVPGII